VRDVRVHGKPAISGATLDLLVSRGDLPVQTAIVLRRERKDLLIPLSDVARFERTPTSGRWVGFFTELTLSAVSVAIMAATWDSSW
jgi:hypothetical protein